LVVCILICIFKISSLLILSNAVSTDSTRLLQRQVTNWLSNCASLVLQILLHHISVSRSVSNSINDRNSNVSDHDRRI
jgi:hypothetical protein